MQYSFLLRFYSPFVNFGTILALNFLNLNLSVKIVHSLWSDIIWIVIRRSKSTRQRTQSIFWSSNEVKGRPGLASSLQSSRPSMKGSIHLKIDVFFNVPSPYTVFNISLISCEFFPNFAKNLIITRCSGCSSISIVGIRQKK